MKTLAGLDYQERGAGAVVWSGSRRRLRRMVRAGVRPQPALDRFRF